MEASKAIELADLVSCLGTAISTDTIYEMAAELRRLADENKELHEHVLGYTDEAGNHWQAIDGKAYHDLSQERDELAAKLAELEKQREYWAMTYDSGRVVQPAPVADKREAFLLGGRRFKIGELEGGNYGIGGLPQEMNGQWIALVDATNDMHMQARAALQPAQSAQTLTSGYFAYDSDNGFELFDTSEKAKSWAQTTLDDFRNDARSDGEWHDDVDSIRWGVVLGKIEEIELPDDGYDGSQGLAGYSKPVDYMLVDCAKPAQPAAVPDEIDTDDAAPHYSHEEASAYAAGWNACRETMLAAAPQPKENGQ